MGWEAFLNWPNPMSLGGHQHRKRRQVTLTGNLVHYISSIESFHENIYIDATKTQPTKLTKLSKYEWNT